MATDRIELTVPAGREFARTVRVTAASIGSRAGMSIDRVEDVRIAVEELFLLMRQAGGEGAELTFVFTVDDATMDIEAAARCDAAVPCVPAEGRYARFILEGVCDAFDMAEDGLSCSVRIEGQDD